MAPGLLGQFWGSRAPSPGFEGSLFSVASVAKALPVRLVPEQSEVATVRSDVVQDRGAMATGCTEWALIQEGLPLPVEGGVV